MNARVVAACALLLAVRCSSAPPLQSPAPFEFVRASTVSSTLVAPGAAHFSGFASNNYPDGPIAVTSCDFSITRDGSGKTIAAISIGIVNKRPYSFDGVTIGYGLTSYSGERGDGYVGGGNYIEISKFGAFEHRIVTKQESSSLGRDVSIDGATCGIADVYRNEGDGLHYPSPTENGSDKAI